MAQIKKRKIELIEEEAPIVAASQKLIDDEEEDDLFPENQLGLSPYTTHQNLLEKYHLTDQKALMNEYGKISENGQYSMMNMLLIIWVDDILVNMIAMTTAIMKKALKDRLLGVKRILYSTLPVISDTIDTLKMGKIPLAKCSLPQFVKSLPDEESFILFTEQAWNQEELDWTVNKYLDFLTAPSSSSASTKTITTSSTIARTQTVPVDADLPNTSKVPDVLPLEEDTLDDLFRTTSSRSSTGLISQSISKKTRDSYVTWTSPGETGYRVIKLDVYDYKNIAGVPKDRWWKEATVRSTFMTSSIADPKDVMITRLLVAAAKDLKKIPGLEEKEKPTSSYNFYEKDRHRQ